MPCGARGSADWRRGSGRAEHLLRGWPRFALEELAQQQLRFDLPDRPLLRAERVAAADAQAVAADRQMKRQHRFPPVLGHEAVAALELRLVEQLDTGAEQRMCCERLAVEYDPPDVDADVRTGPAHDGRVLKADQAVQVGLAGQRVCSTR